MMGEATPQRPAPRPGFCLNIRQLGSALAIGLLLVAGLFVSSAQAEPIVLHRNLDHIEIGPHADVLVDETSALKLNDVVASPTADHFKRNYQTNILMAGDQGVTWVRFWLSRPQSGAGIGVSRILFLDGLPAEAALFVPILGDHGTEYKTSRSGRLIPSQGMALASNRVAFALPAQFDVRRPFLLRIESYYKFSHSISLRSVRNYTSMLGGRTIYLGLLFGVILLLAAYNLIFYLMIRDRTYLLYVFFVLAMAYWQANLTGLFHFIDSSTSSFINHHTTNQFSSAVTMFFGAAFTISFLRTRSSAPWVHRGLVAAMIILLCAAAANLIAPGRDVVLILESLLHPLAGILTLSVICTAAVLWRRGYEPARYFFFAWTVLALGSILFILTGSQVRMPWPFPWEFTVITSSAIESVLLSFALGDRMRSALRREQQETEASISMAEAANRAKSEFLVSMSHELRTPLNAVLGFARLMQHDSANRLNAAQTGRVDNILAGGNHLLELINGVLDLAEIEADQLSLSIEDVNANEAVANCIGLTTPLSATRGITVNDEFSDGAIVHLRADRLRLNQILLNLLSNAIKYNKDSGTVTLTGGEVKGGYFRISVSDTGIGIPLKDRADIFQRFYRVETNQLIAKTGSGLGLTVTKLLIERMAGRIGFESEEDAGSVFWIELPMAASNKTVSL